MHTVTQLLHFDTAIISLLFRSNFAVPLDIYKRLGQFDYGQPHCTRDHIHACYRKYEYADWIYIGEVKEGTDDIPHGIGIQVAWHGGTQQLCNKRKLR